MDFIDRLVHEAYAFHVIVTEMGFDPIEVQACLRDIVNSDPPGLHACVILARGSRQFVFHIQPVSEAQGASFQERWLDFAAAKPGMPRDALDAIVKSSSTWGLKAELLWALEAKGFTLEPGKMVH